MQYISTTISRRAGSVLATTLGVAVAGASAAIETTVHRFGDLTIDVVGSGPLPGGGEALGFQATWRFQNFDDMLGTRRLETVTTLLTYDLYQFLSMENPETTHDPRDDTATATTFLNLSGSMPTVIAETFNHFSIPDGGRTFTDTFIDNPWLDDRATLTSSQTRASTSLRSWGSRNPATNDVAVLFMHGSSRWRGGAESFRRVHRIDWRFHELQASYDFTILPGYGDTDSDNDSDYLDFLALTSNWGRATSSGPVDGDFNGDGIVNWEDLEVFQTNPAFHASLTDEQAAIFGDFERGVISPIGPEAFDLALGDPIPEPCLGGLMGVGLAGLVLRRRCHDDSRHCRPGRAAT